ncbi:MAG: hypothetical protein ACHQUC_05870 [Chlamydiales bacterium]
MCASSSSEPKPVALVDSFTYQKLTLCAHLFREGEVSRVKALDVCRVLAWTQNDLAIVGSERYVSRIQLPKRVSIDRVISIGEGSFIVVGENNRVYQWNQSTTQFRDVTHARSGVLKKTVTLHPGGIAWSSKTNSLVLVDGETGKLIFKSKLSGKRKITAIASVGQDILAVGTSNGRVIAYDRKGLILCSHHLEQGKPIVRLKGDEVGYLAAQVNGSVMVIRNFQSSKLEVLKKERMSLMPKGRCFQGGLLLMKQDSSYSNFLSPLRVWDLSNNRSYILQNDKFSEIAYAEFTLGGLVVGGVGDEINPLKVWDASTGHCLAFTDAVDGGMPITQDTLGFVLCPESDATLGFVDVAKGYVTRYEIPHGLTITDYTSLPNGDIFVASSDGGLYTSPQAQKG